MEGRNIDKIFFEKFSSYPLGVIIPSSLGACGIEYCPVELRIVYMLALYNRIYLNG